MLESSQELLFQVTVVSEPSRQAFTIFVNDEQVCLKTPQQVKQFC
jgi:hypothetical protein